MLSFISKIKKIINDKLKNRYNVRKRQYEVVFGSDIMTVYPECGDEITVQRDDNNDDTPLPPPPSPVIFRTLFRIKIDTTIIDNDYELQKLLRIMDIHNIDVEHIVLEPRYEAAISNIPEISDIIKIKLRLLYIIIANNVYQSLFEEYKQYRCIKNIQYIGVFRYGEYIIRIDDSPYSFINEDVVVNALHASSNNNNNNSNIIRPFLIYTNIKKNTSNEICDCVSHTCNCTYYDDADNHPDVKELNEESRICYNKLRSKSISFSIQHYEKETLPLYNWVKENIGNSVYSQFSTIQTPFFIHLFYKCAKLLRDIHTHSIVHGDIKPDNILIREHDNFDMSHPDKCKNFTVYLIDFGLSGINEKGIGTGGTIPYCHPEFKNIRDTSRSIKYHWRTLQFKHDVWSLGLMFITMYIYRDCYNYYYKYPNYFFMNNGYVSSLILDTISDKKLNHLFTIMLSEDGISIAEVCDALCNMKSNS